MIAEEVSTEQNLELSKADMLEALETCFHVLDVILLIFREYSTRQWGIEATTRSAQRSVLGPDFWNVYDALLRFGVSGRSHLVGWYWGIKRRIFDQMNPAYIENGGAASQQIHKWAKTIFSSGENGSGRPGQKEEFHSSSNTSWWDNSRFLYITVIDSRIIFFEQIRSIDIGDSRSNCDRSGRFMT